MLHERLDAYECPRRTPAPPAAQIVASIVCIGCALCCIGNYMTCTLYGFETDTTGFLRIGACLLVLPASMTLICLNHVEYRAFERVRHDPRTQIIDNLRIIGVLSASTAVGGVALFAFVAATRIGLPQGYEVVVLLAAVQMTFMMNVAVALLNMLLSSCGLPWIYGTAILVASFVLVERMLEPMAGDITRYLCFFWYPISFDWGVIFFQQTLPFIGYCIVMILMITMIFEHREQLGA